LWPFAARPESGKNIENFKKNLKNACQTSVKEKNRQDLPPPNLKNRSFQTKFLTCGFKVNRENFNIENLS
jgi:hypothetical protein